MASGFMKIGNGCKKSKYFLYIDNGFYAVYDGVNSNIQINYVDGDTLNAEKSQES